MFHMNIDPELVSQLRTLLEQIPQYPDGGHLGDWNPIVEIERRKLNPHLRPYCLFTSYFSTTYFGLRQCVEIDSLRFAIDQLSDLEDRQWALGALIVAVSAVGTTYAGHFAQPVLNVEKSLSPVELYRIIDKRMKPVSHEFCTRLLNLAEESQSPKTTIQTLPGPWPRALESLSQVVGRKPVLVYVDAPYKRDEYSRYYHLLETLVKYDYPSSLGIGRTPDKRTNQRFSSEFFTRRSSTLTRHFVRLIGEILNRGWIAAWSYADSGDASPIEVIEEIAKEHECRVLSRSTHHRHRSQGRRPGKKVREYIVFFVPH